MKEIAKFSSLEIFKWNKLSPLLDNLNIGVICLSQGLSISLSLGNMIYTSLQEKVIKFLIASHVIGGGSFCTVILSQELNPLEMHIQY